MRTSSWIVVLGVAAAVATALPTDGETDEEWFRKQEGQGCKCSGEFVLCKYNGRTPLNLHNRCQKNFTTIILSARNTHVVPEDMFAGLYHVEWLYFENSNITTLPRTLLKDMNNTQLLSFNENHIEKVPAELFVGMDYIETVHFSNNVIKNIPVQLLAGHDTLKNIAFDGNRLKTLHAGVFKGLDGVKYLNLQRNQIETLPDGLFQDMSSLTHLDLSSNKLKVVTGGIMRGPELLQFCNMEGNAFTSLPFHDSRWPLVRTIKFHGSRITSLNETAARAWLLPRDKAVSTKVRVTIKESPLTNLKSILWAVEDSSLNKTVEQDCACGSITYQINTLHLCLSISCGHKSNSKNWIEAVKRTKPKTSVKHTHKPSSTSVPQDSNHAPSFAHSHNLQISSPFTQPTTQISLLTSFQENKPEVLLSHPSHYAPNSAHSSPSTTLSSSPSQSSLSSSFNHHFPSSGSKNQYNPSYPHVHQTQSPLMIPDSPTLVSEHSHSSSESKNQYAPSHPHVHQTQPPLMTPDSTVLLSEHSHSSSGSKNQYAPSYPHVHQTQPPLTIPDSPILLSDHSHSTLVSHYSQPTSHTHLSQPTSFSPKPTSEQPPSSHVNHVAFQPTSPPISQEPSTSSHYATSFPRSNHVLFQTSTPKTETSHTSSQYAPSYTYTGEPKTSSVSLPLAPQDLTIEQPAKPENSDQYAPSFPHTSKTESSTPSHNNYAPLFPHNRPPNSVSPQPFTPNRVTQSPPQLSSAPPPSKFPTLSPPQEQNMSIDNDVSLISPPSSGLNRPPHLYQSSLEPTYPHNHPPIIRLLKQ